MAWVSTRGKGVPFFFAHLSFLGGIVTRACAALEREVKILVRWWVGGEKRQMGREELMACLPRDSEVVKKFLEWKVECECGSLVQPCSLKTHRATKRHARLMEERLGAAQTSQSVR